MKKLHALALLEWFDTMICADNCVIFEEEDGGVIMQFKYAGKTTTFIDLTVRGCLNQAYRKYGPSETE